jgi:putative transcriptional regulator
MDSKTEFLILLGDNIRKYRTAKSYSQQHLADELNIAKSTIQRIESGTLNPTIWALKNIASTLEVEVDDLIK